MEFSKNPNGHRSPCILSLTYPDRQKSDQKCLKCCEDVKLRYKVLYGWVSVCLQMSVQFHVHTGGRCLGESRRPQHNIKSKANRIKIVIYCIRFDAVVELLNYIYFAENKYCVYVFRLIRCVWLCDFVACAPCPPSMVKCTRARIFVCDCVGWVAMCSCCISSIGTNMFDCIRTAIGIVVRGRWEWQVKNEIDDMERRKERKT